MRKSTVIPRLLSTKKRTQRLRGNNETQPLPNFCIFEKGTHTATFRSHPVGLKNNTHKQTASPLLKIKLVLILFLLVCPASLLCSLSSLLFHLSLFTFPFSFPLSFFHLSTSLSFFSSVSSSLSSLSSLLFHLLSLSLMVDGCRLLTPVCRVLCAACCVSCVLYQVLSDTRQPTSSNHHPTIQQPTTNNGREERGMGLSPCFLVPGSCFFLGCVSFMCNACVGVCVHHVVNFPSMWPLWFHQPCMPSRLRAHAEGAAHDRSDAQRGWDR